MSDAAGSPAKGGAKAGGWTDAQKLALMTQIAVQNGNPNWKTLKVPEGRTIKACQHVWFQLKALAETVPVGEAATPEKKSTAKAGTKRAKEENDEGDKQSVARKSRKKKGDEAAEGDEKVTIKREEGGNGEFEV